MDSPLPQHSLWACGSVCRSPALRCWPSLHPSPASETAATAHKAAPSLQLHRVKRGGERDDRQCDDTGFKTPEVNSDKDWKTYCCSPSCRSKGLFLRRCAQMCNSRCRRTSSRPSRAYRSRKRREGLSELMGEVWFNQKQWSWKGCDIMQNLKEPAGCKEQSGQHQWIKI